MVSALGDVPHPQVEYAGKSMKPVSAGAINRQRTRVTAQHTNKLWIVGEDAGGPIRANRDECNLGRHAVQDNVVLNLEQVSGRLCWSFQNYTGIEVRRSIHYCDREWSFQPCCKSA